jgi:hypothetical protein
MPMMRRRRLFWTMSRTACMYTPFPTCGDKPRTLSLDPSNLVAAAGKGRRKVWGTYILVKEIEERALVRRHGFLVDIHCCRCGLRRRTEREAGGRREEREGVWECCGVGRLKSEVVLAGGGARCGGKVEVFAPEFGIVGLGRPTITSFDSKTRRRYRKAHQTARLYVSAQTTHRPLS